MPTRIIGHYAAIQHGIHLGRELSDIDLFTNNPLLGGEGSVIDTFWHPKFYELSETYGWSDKGSCTATLHELYTIKLSHSAWELPNGSWNKHMRDAMIFKQNGAQLIKPMYDVLYTVWEEKHGKKRVNLNMDASDFFDDAVARIYDHDSIHASVAYYDHPLYEDVMSDGQSVKTDMKKVWALPFDLQVKLFREEIYATALERIVIPRDYKCSPLAAYAWALRRTVTSLTKGQSSLFIASNYDIFQRPDIDYVSHHRKNAHKLIRLEK